MDHRPTHSWSREGVTLDCCPCRRRDAGLRLRPRSPIINHEDNSAVPPEVTIDPARIRNAAIIGLICSTGSYWEFEADDAC